MTAVATVGCALANGDATMVTTVVTLVGISSPGGGGGASAGSGGGGGGAEDSTGGRGGRSSVPVVEYERFICNVGLKNGMGLIKSQNASIFRFEKTLTTSTQINRVSTILPNCLRKPRNKHRLTI